jgi:hypothetical protein
METTITMSSTEQRRARMSGGRVVDLAWAHPFLPWRRSHP